MESTARRTPSSYAVLWAIGALGLGVHLAGLAVDKWLHDRDPGLAAREGVFTLSNPGHALIFAGLALIAASIGGMGAHWFLARPAVARGWRREAASAGMLVAVAGLAVGVVVLTAADRDSTHSHAATAEAAADHSHDTATPTAAVSNPTPSAEPAVAHAHPTEAAATSAPVMSEENAHFHHEEVPVSEEHLRAGLAFVDDVRAATAEYADIRAAIANGYVQLTQDLPGIAAHFARLDYFSDGRELDATAPEVLLYSKRLDGTWRFLGVMFQSKETIAEPPNYFGGLDSWHYHTDLCFTFGNGAATVRVVEIEAECVAPSIYNDRTPWELHVWTEPGATGPFSHDYAPISPGAFPPASEPAVVELGLPRMSFLSGERR